MAQLDPGSFRLPGAIADRAHIDWPFDTVNPRLCVRCYPDAAENGAWVSYDKTADRIVAFKRALKLLNLVALQDARITWNSYGKIPGNNWAYTWIEIELDPNAIDRSAGGLGESIWQLLLTP